MPGLGGTLTLCTAHGAVIFMPDAPTPDDQGKAASHAPCAFSALGELAAAPPPVVLLYAAAIVMVLALWFSPAPPGGDPACVRRQAPRAPPRLFE